MSTLSGPKSLLSRLLMLLLVTLGFTLVGCPPTGDDDDDTASSDEAGEPCSGTGCVNNPYCPDEEPNAADACTFMGNCHYCTDTPGIANGYTCDGASFTSQGTFDCDE